VNAGHRIAIIVLNYRTPDLVRDCLATLPGNYDPALDRVIVVDNESGDGSAEKIRREIAERGYPSMQVLETGHNGGFAYGNNAGIRAVEAQAYMLLNSDTLVRPDALERLWRTLQAHPEAGMISPRLEWPDGTAQISCFRLHTPWSELIAGAETSVVTRLLARYDVPLPVSESKLSPEWTSFAAVMIRKQVIDAIGALDDGFFMYYEDVDFCRRVTDAGFSIVHDPEAHVVHLRGGSSPVKQLTAQRKRRPAYYYHSRARYFRNAYGLHGLVAANVAWSAGRYLSWLRERFGKKQPHVVQNELLDLWGSTLSSVTTDPKRR